MNLQPQCYSSELAVKRERCSSSDSLTHIQWQSWQRYSEIKLSPLTFRPADPIRRKEPFDDEKFVFELKHDGFRALAHITAQQCRLISRRGNVYKSFVALSLGRFQL